MRIPWEYMTLEEFMSTVKSRLSLFDDSGMIDNDRYIPVIMACNEKLGERIFRSVDCTISVKDYKSDTPIDMFRIENMFAVTTDCSIYNTNPLIPGARQLEFSTEAPDCNLLVGTMTSPCPGGDCSPPCELTDFNNNYFVTARKKEDIFRTFQNIRPLILSNNIRTICTDYCPATRWQGEYQVDIVDGEFSFSFKEGTVYISYLSNLIDNDGNILIPKHPLLNDYYMYTVMERIMEDIYLNSEADIIQRLQYIGPRKDMAYNRAWSFVNSAQVGQFSRLKKKWQMEYYENWYKAFDNC